MEKRKRGNPFEFPFSPLRIHTDLVRTFRDGVRRNASAGWRNHRGQRQTRGIYWVECPDSDRLNKYRESHGGALKLEARLHLLLHIHCESVEWRELRGGKT